MEELDIEADIESQIPEIKVYKLWDKRTNKFTHAKPWHSIGYLKAHIRSNYWDRKTGVTSVALDNLVVIELSSITGLKSYSITNLF